MIVRMCPPLSRTLWRGLSDLVEPVLVPFGKGEQDVIALVSDHIALFVVEIRPISKRLVAAFVGVGNPDLPSKGAVENEVGQDTTTVAC